MSYILCISCPSLNDIPCLSGGCLILVAALVASTLTNVKPFSAGIGDLWRAYHFDILLGRSGPLVLDIPLWVGTMNTGDGFGHHLG